MDLTGKTLGRYRELQRIGAGGMGVVYRAHDSRLAREVAIKVLPPGSLGDDVARKRFHREALLLAQLGHPNIATIFDLDTHEGADLLVMEYIPGRSVDEMLGEGPLAEAEVLRLGTQLAQGVAAAHERGTLHRDLKPANLRVLPDGRLKILDFGIGKLLHPPTQAMTQETLTDTQVVSGTLPYMAPEQLSGGGADERADVYAIGAVLFEMATGRRLFPQPPGLPLLNAILREAPPRPREVRPDISPQLEAVILKAVARPLDRRYGSAKELLADLEALVEGRAPKARAPAAAWPRRAVLAAGLVAALAALVWLLRPLLREPPGSGGRVMMAVLPFENLSAAPDQDYFSDGLTEEMISRIGALNPDRLAVIARASAMAYKGTRKTVGQIGRELHVDYLVAGSVRRAAGRVRITALLSRASDQVQVWSETFERPVADVWALQSEVAERVARSLQVKLLPDRAGRRAAAPLPEAHEAYLRARYFWNKRTEEDLRKSVRQYEEALRLQPDYAQAAAGLAEAWLLMAGYRFAPAAEAVPEARRWALRAKELDPSLPGPYAVLASIRQDQEWDWAGAEQDFRHALELDPGYATAHQWYADLLAATGRLDLALQEMRAAQGLDPLSLIIQSDVAACQLYARRYGEAVAEYRKALDLDPEYQVAWFGLSTAQWFGGQRDSAVESLARGLELTGAAPADVQGLRAAYRGAGEQGFWRWRLAALEARSAEGSNSPYDFGALYAALGEKDRAFEWLDRAIRERAEGVTGLRIDPLLAGLRGDPRYAALERRVGLPPG